MTKIPPTTRAALSSAASAPTRNSGLAREAYTCPDIYRQETERIFQRHWLCVEFTANLPSPGSYAAPTAAEQPLLLLRGEDRMVRGFHNVCRHRGARLACAAHGQLDGALCCPYHGWSYDSAGQLVAAPRMAAAPGFALCDYPLLAVAVESWNGLLFANFAANPAPLAQKLSGLGSRFDHYQLGDWRPAWQHVYDVNANWKLLFQNYHECYHCPVVHPQLNALSSYKTAQSDLQQGLVLGGPMRLSAGVESLTTTGRLCGNTPAALSPAEKQQVWYYGIFPNLFFSLHPDYLMVHRLERLHTASTRVTCSLHFAPQAIERPDFDPTPAADFWHQTNEQDWEMCQRVQQGMASGAYVPGPYAPGESLLPAFDAFYSSLMEDREPA